MSNGIEQVGLALWGDRWQSEMARALNVSRDSIQDWKNGRMNPRPGVYADLLRIARERHADVENVIQLLTAITRPLGPPPRLIRPAPKPDTDDEFEEDHGPELR